MGLTARGLPRSRTELSRVVEIDRRERIDVLYDQTGSQLVARHGRWTRPPGTRTATANTPSRPGEHEHCVDTGGIALGAFANGRVAGIGSCRSEQFEQIARTACDSDMVVAATPPENTVRFYLGRGFQPMAKPLAELFELEPDDVHMHKVL